MSNQEAQEEELEVLNSIYEGDTEFKSVDNHTFQYKFGTEGEKTTVLIEVQWPNDYPEVKPNFSLSAFYNNHLSSAAKSALLDALNEEAEKNVGSQQTYTLIEWARESLEGVIAPHISEDNLSSRADALSLESKSDKVDDVAKIKVRKEQLTKNQKRKEWDRSDGKGEKLRGYDWIDIVKHLSQTGGKPDFMGDAGCTSAPAENYLDLSDLPN